MSWHRDARSARNETFEIEDKNSCQCSRAQKERRVLIAAKIWRNVPSRATMVEAATRELLDAVDALYEEES